MLHAYNMAKTAWRKGNPLDSMTLSRLRALVAERGSREAAKTIKLAEVSVLRAVAGQGLRRGTIVLIKIGLEALVDSAAA